MTHYNTKYISKIPAMRDFVLKAKPFISTLWGQLYITAITVGSVRAYTTLLTPSEFGNAMIAFGAINLLDGIIIMSFSQSLMLFASKFQASSLQQSFAAALLLKMMRRISPYITLIIIIAVIAAIQAGIKTSLAAYAFVLTPVYICTELLKTAMLSVINLSQKYSKYSFWTAYEVTITTFASITGILLSEQKELGFVVGFVIGRAISAFSIFMIEYKAQFFKGVSSQPLNIDFLKVVKYGAPVSLMSIFGWLSSFSDRYILLAFSNASAVGIYAASVGLVNRPFAILTATLTNVFRPKLLTARSHNNYIEANRLLKLWLSSALISGAFGLLVLILLGDILISAVLAPTYRESAKPIMIIIGTGLTFNIMTHGLDNGILSKGESSKLLAPQIISILITLAAIPLLTMKYGLFGAAVGKVIGDVTKFIFTFIAVHEPRQRLWRKH